MVKASATLRRSTAPRGRQRVPTSGTDARRERILAVAEHLFATQGYPDTSMNQIVSALGVTKPFVYYYFRDKQEILEHLSWPPAVACFTTMDFAPDDTRCAAEKISAGIERLIRITVETYPASFFTYRERASCYRPEYRRAQTRLANHFYDKLCALMQQGRADGSLAFSDTKITALAACSLPGFMYSWYKPDGRMPADAVIAELTRLALRVLGVEGVRIADVSIAEVQGSKAVL